MSNAKSFLCLRLSGTSPLTIRIASPSTIAVSDSRFADEHGVILGSAGQDLNHTPDFVVATDDRVELALSGQLGQIPPVFHQRLVGPFGVLAGDTLIAAHLLQSGQETVPGKPQFLEHSSFLNHRQQHMLDAEKVVLERFLFVLRMVEDLVQAGGNMHLPGSGAGALYLGQLGQGVFDRLPNRRQGKTGPFKQGRRRSTFLVEQRQQHVLDIDALMASSLRMARAD